MSLPPGSSYKRQGTGQRVGSSYKNSAAVAAAGDLSLVDRPMSMYGLKSSHGGAGPTRQVRDGQYFSMIVRKKMSNLTEELAKYQKQLAALENEDQTYMTYEKRYEDLAKEIRDLEGTLADYNLARDKLRGKTRPEDVEASLKRLQEDNRERADQLDDAYLEKKKREKALETLEKEAENLRKDMIHQLERQHPDRHHEFSQLESDSVRLEQAIHDSRVKLQEAQFVFNELRDKFSRDAVARGKFEAYQLKEDLRRLQMNRDEMEDRLSMPPMSEPEQKDLLHQQISEVVGQISTLKSKKDASESEFWKLNSRLQEIVAELESPGDPESDRKKQLIITQADKLVEFINTAPQKIDGMRAQLAGKQDNINQQLHEIARLHHRKQNLPTAAKAVDVKDELDFKERQLENSMQTEQRVEQLYREKLAQFDRLKTIDQELPNEIQLLHERIAEATKELDNMPSDEQIRAAAKEETAMLEERKDQLEMRKVFMRPVLTASSMLSGDAVDALEKALNAKDVPLAFSADLEGKIRAALQQLLNLRTQVVVEEKKNDCEHLKQDVLKLTEQINQLLLKQLHNL